MTSGQDTKQNERVRILVVDDEPLIRRALSHVLGEMHDVTTACNGREALKVLNEDSDYDVIITDLSMPVMGGIKLHRQLVLCHPHLKSRVIFCSGAPPNGAMQHIQSSGNVFLQKPVDPAQLLNTIQYLVDTA